MDALYRMDMSVFRAVHVGLHESWLDPVFWVITSTGLAEVQIPIILLFLIWKSTRKYVLPLLLVLLVSGVPVAQGIKHLVDRDRPSNLAFVHPQENIFYHSFPSGHSTTEFALGFLLLLMTWGTRRTWWGWAWVGWACLVGLSRMYRGVHWPTDVLAGMFCGLFSAALIYLIFRSRLDDSDFAETVAG